MLDVKRMVCDVDGVFTSGQFIYNDKGKQFKIFGAHDADGIKMLKSIGVSVSAITADRRGYHITEKRMHDMALDLTLVTEENRLAYLKHLQVAGNVCFMGDGHHDALAFQHVRYSIAPANAVPLAKLHASYVTEARGGEGAVYEAALHLISKLGKKNA